MSELSILDEIKLRLNIWYEDPIKDKELELRIKSCQEDLAFAGVGVDNLNSALAIDTIERYILGGQNDNVYIANVTKLKAKGGVNGQNSTPIL